MADEKNRKGDKGPKSGKTKRTVGTVLGTGFFAVLSTVSYTHLTLPTTERV